jgi:hypothetical protein
MSAARPEAAFYAWRALTHGQRRVAADIQSWLKAFSSMDIPARAAGKTIFDWQRIDETRASNVVVIDGPRGAGKTSLMLTLVELWRRDLAQEQLDEVFATSIARPGEVDLASLVSGYGEPDMATARDALEPLRGKIIPIRVLDFAPLPRSTSLVTWVAAQLREFIDLLDERATPALSEASTRAVVPWEPDWDKELPSRRAWADLVASAAWGWDDNLQARKGALDPDAYAEELQQSERARVGIVERWRTLIGAIVKDAAERHRGRIKTEARIVIPIDDVDMNPQRTAELLDFVRTFWDPQLVFLLSGDSNLILAAFREYHAKALGMTGNDVSASRDELAAQSYDKVVPVAQRFRISPVSPAERVELLQEQLSKGSGPAGAAPSTPSTTMTVPTPTLALVDLLRRDRWAAEALPSTLREIHDMRQMLAGHVKVSEVVVDLWSNALARERLAPEIEHKITERVDLGRDGVPAVEVDIDALAERLGEFRVKSSSDPPRNQRTHLVLEAVSGLRPLDMPQNLSVRVRGAVLLAADIAADDPDSAWSQISIAGRGYKFPAVRARIVITTASAEPAEAGAHDLLRKGVRWPVPDWPAPVDAASFADKWRTHILTTLNRRDTDRDQTLAISFLAQVRSVFIERTGQTTVSTPATLKEVMELIVKEGSQTATTPWHQAYVEWARARAPLLAAPESGLQIDTAKLLLSALPTGPSEQALAQQARFNRTRITLETLSDKQRAHDVDKVLITIDNNFAGHPWVGHFGGIWKPGRAPER